MITSVSKYIANIGKNNLCQWCMSALLIVLSEKQGDINI